MPEPLVPMEATRAKLAKKKKKAFSFRLAKILHNYPVACVMAWSMYFPVDVIG